MEFLPAELIRKKRFGGEHSREELRFLLKHYVADDLPNYQMAAWLMAVCAQGMTPEETSAFTLEMRDSGRVLDLGHLGTTVDKHSTGGLGDKTSLILAPLVAAAGVPVPMMAGRGLGHTGGTLDKLESIPGFDVHVDLEHFQQLLETVGTAIIGQTFEVCPADRKLYALRDVTGTIDSLPLICGSIMSKKLAEGMSALVLDVKFGSGAFMKTQAQAEDLARALMDIGVRNGKRVTAFLTRMDEPLGRFIGNALEVQECLDIMAGKTSNGAPGKTYADTIELTLALAAQMIFMGGKAANTEHGRTLAEKLLANGSALRKFEQICAAQGGRLTEGLPRAERRETVTADRDGFFEYLDLEKLGHAAVFLGAGRKVQSDELDMGAGLEVFCRQSQAVKKGDPIFTLHFSETRGFASALAALNEGFQISTRPLTESPLIAKVLT
ncbi:MAG: thymidine phosphorylase [Bdellovibrionales bacterium]|nr:thymidine phosphorylase [Bdellovibrionales bacterium]